MADISTPVEAVSAVTNFLISRTAALPDDFRPALFATIDPATMVSPVPACHDIVELIYARRDELPPELLAIGAQTASMMAGFRLMGMAEDNRGYAIAAAIHDMPGVAAPVPAQLEAPEPKVAFMPAPEPEVPLIAPDAADSAAPASEG